MLQFAAAKEVITPAKPVYMAGFAARKHQSTGVHDDLYAKIVVLRSNTTLLIISLDVLGGDRSFVSGIKRVLAEKFGLQEAEILINFSHTHASVYLTGEDSTLRRGRYSIGLKTSYPAEHDQELDYSEDIAYFQYLKQILIGLVSRCFGSLKEGALQYGSGQTAMSISRRLVTEEGVDFAPNEQGEIDREVSVVKLVNLQGTPEVILFSHGCHPTSMNNYQVSAEFVGHACQMVEEKNPGSMAVFLQGCAAEVKPRGSVGPDGRFKRCTFAEMQQIGKDFAADVCFILENSPFREIEPKFNTYLTEVSLCTQKVSPSVYEEKLLDEKTPAEMRPVYKRLSKAMQKGISRNRLPLTIMIWRLGDMRWVALEGEIASGYSLMIKELLGKERTMVLGYSNGVFTYVPTRQMILEGGYEAERAPLMHGFEAPFMPESEAVILGAIVQAEMLGDKNKTITL